MGRGWFICGGSGKDTVPRPPLRESEGDEVSVKPAAPADEDDAPTDEGESEFEIWSGDLCGNQVSGPHAIDAT
jgi:hypothetical protein